VMKEEPQANRERVTECLVTIGVTDADKIIKEVDDFIEIHNAGLTSALNVLGIM